MLGRDVDDDGRPYTAEEKAAAANDLKKHTRGWGEDEVGLGLGGEGDTDNEEDDETCKVQ